MGEVLASTAVAIHMLAVRIVAEGPGIHNLAVVHIAPVVVDQVEAVEVVCYNLCFAGMEADRMKVEMVQRRSLGIAVAQATEMVSSNTVAGWLESRDLMRRSSPCCYNH